MKSNEKKSVPIEVGTWREMAQEKLDSGKDIYQLVSESWRFYKARKAGEASAEIAANNSGGNSGLTGADFTQFRLQFEKPLQAARRHAEILRSEADKADEIVSELEVAIESRHLKAARESLPSVRAKRPTDGKGAGIRPTNPRSGTGAP